MQMTLNRAAMAGLPEESVVAIGLLVARPLVEPVGAELARLLSAATGPVRRSSKSGRVPRSVSARRPGGSAPKRGAGAK